MSFKTGDLVNMKGDKNDVMSIIGFLQFLNQNVIETNSNPERRDWVLCVFLNDKQNRTIFHRDQLELYSSDIDGGTPNSHP
ncbi:MAG: hypothetical protein Q8J69_04070 [Sphingobacteriaceae bacterium]|nr:hypothetical protein [Sphingobacteriaceae bacterium]